MTSLVVPELVHRRALSSGAAGQRWLDELPSVVDKLVAKEVARRCL